MGAVQAIAPETPRGMLRLADALTEALSFPIGAEVVVRSEQRVGRIFIVRRHIAWVTASSMKGTLSTLLEKEAHVKVADLQAAFDESKKMKENFAETLVRWNLVDAVTLRRVMLSHTAQGLLEVAAWEPLIALVVPSTREYLGQFTFPIDEVLAQSCAFDSMRCNTLRPLAALSGPMDTPASRTHHAHLPVCPNKETLMALETVLKEFKGIKGYKATGIMNYTGEMVVSDSVEPSIDLNMVGATFNDIFRSSHEVCSKIGLQACNEMVITTPSGIIVMRCTGVTSKLHIHGICILASDGNQALTKMTMEKWLPKAMDELA